MKKQFLEAGQIVNTHGIHGDVRIQPWCDNAQFLLDIEKYYIDGKPVVFTDRHVHKTLLIARPEGVSNANDAALLKGKVLYFDRDDVQLDDDRVFISDLIGLDAVDEATGLVFGKVSDVMNMPASDVYTIKGDREYMIPAVSQFLKGIDLQAGTITFKLIEGLAIDEN